MFEEAAVEAVPLPILIYSAVLLLLGLACSFADLFIFDSRRHRLPQWRTSWGEFGLLFGVIFFFIIVFQFAFSSIAHLTFGDDPPEFWYTTLVGGSMHFAIIFSILIVKTQYPAMLAQPFNEYKLPPHHVIAKGLFFLFSAMPLLMILSGLWRMAFELWAQLGFEVETPVQYMVEFLAETEDLSPVIALSIFAVIIAPISEEIFFRGVLYRFLKYKYPPLFALTISSLVFALIHFNIASFLPLFLLGMLLGRAYEKTGNLSVSICIHAVFNFNTVAILLLTPTV